MLTVNALPRGKAAIGNRAYNNGQSENRFHVQSYPEMDECYLFAHWRRLRDTRCRLPLAINVIGHHQDLTC